MKLTLPFDLSNVKTPDDIQRFLSQSIKQIIAAVNGGITFSDNFDARIISVSFTAANLNVSTTHTLNRVPTGYIPINLSAGMIVFNGSQPNSANVINLSSTAAGMASLLIF